MLKKILIIGSVTLFLGISTLTILSVREYDWRKTKNEYKSKYSTNDSDYLHKYRLWLEVPEYHRSEFPWDIDANLSLGTIEEVRQNQNERFLAEADNLNDIETDMYPVAKILYGENWQQKLKKYKNVREFVKIGFILAIVSSSIGGAIVLSTASVILLRHLLNRKKQIEIPEEGQVNIEQEDVENCQEQEDSEKESIQSILNCHPYSNEITDNDLSERQKTENENQTDYHTETDENTIEKKEPQNTEENIKSEYKEKLIERLRRRKEREATINKTQTELKAKNESGLWNRTKGVTKNHRSNPADIKVHAEKKGEVIHETLNKLTEEVAAMRRYAGQQQEKLTDMRKGYDWNIIRSFGLRVIRCIDNLENKIQELSYDDPAKSHLEEVRDELIFALESSGLERYEPQVNSDYRGQEKTAETVKEKQNSNNPALKGKISNVLRCGYRYMVDDENYKIVRAAQVRLFS